MSKYDPLGTYLEAIPERTNRWRASFGDLEKVLGFRLPKSARTYQAWWANDGSSHPQKAVWLDIGWRTEELDLGSEKVTFCRDDLARANFSRARSKSKQPHPRQSPKAPISETSAPWSWDRPESVHCKAGFSWRPVGRVLVDTKGKLLFPNVDSEPGIYRLRLKSDGKTRDYIGESDNLRRRFRNYRQGPEGQQTSFRIHNELHQALKDGTQISIAIMEATVCQPAGATVDRQSDLSRKAVRRLFENLAQVLLGAEDIELLNR